MIFKYDDHEKKNKLDGFQTQMYPAEKLDI